MFFQIVSLSACLVTHFTFQLWWFSNVNYCMPSKSRFQRKSFLATGNGTLEFFFNIMCLLMLVQTMLATHVFGTSTTSVPFWFQTHLAMGIPSTLTFITCPAQATCELRRVRIMYCAVPAQKICSDKFFSTSWSRARK